jgi:hypothetical protein
MLRFMKTFEILSWKFAFSVSKNGSNGDLQVQMVGKIQISKLGDFFIFESRFLKDDGFKVLSGNVT